MIHYYLALHENLHKCFSHVVSCFTQMNVMQAALLLENGFQVKYSLSGREICVLLLPVIVFSMKRLSHIDTHIYKCRNILMDNYDVWGNKH